MKDASTPCTWLHSWLHSGLHPGLHPGPCSGPNPARLSASALLGSLVLGLAVGGFPRALSAEPVLQAARGSVVDVSKLVISQEPAVRKSNEVAVVRKALARRRLRQSPAKVALARPVAKPLAKPLAKPAARQGKAQARAVALVAAAGQGAAAEEKDPNSTNLLLPESSDLNRILEKATEFFAKDRWEDGIEFIQGLLEGTAKVEIGPDHLNDPRYSVYSGDSRLYIPFTEFCQDLLASLPPEGLEVYRGLTDGRAGEAFDKAAAQLDQTRLEELSRLYFATSYGPKILSLLADLATLHGDLPKAIHLRDRLLRSYPDLDASVAEALRLRQLQAFALMGDLAAFEDDYREMRMMAPDSRYRVAGDLVPLDKLPDLPAFHIREASLLNEAENTPRTLGNAEGMDLTHLVPMWDFRFTDPDPYSLRRKNTNSRTTFWMGGQGAMYVPGNKDARPGIFGTAFGPGHERRLAVKDHESLVILDMLSGIPVARDPDGGHKKKGPRVSNNNRNQLRVRLPSNDYAQQKVGIVDGDLYLTVKNKVSTGRTNTFPFRNQLERYLPADGSWEVLSEASPTKGMGPVYYEGPPVGYGEWLYAPVRKKKTYGLAKLRRSDGKLESVVTIHSGGSRYLRPPAVSPVRVGHQIIQLTNAGCVASFSLPNLELRWLRRYETWMRLQSPPRVIRSNTRRMWSGIRTEKLRFWDPVDPIVVGDKIVLAPVDADTLICLDVQSGTLEWILPRSEKKGRKVRFKQILGPAEGRIYLIGDHIQCVDVPSGKRMWEAEIGSGAVYQAIGDKVEGLGTLVGNKILLPLASGKVAVFATEDGQFEQLLVLPALRLGEEGVEAPFNLQVDGPVLLALSEVRVAAFTVPESLLASARDDLDRVDRLLVSGRGEAARQLLGNLLVAKKLNGEEAVRGRELYIRLAGETSHALKKEKKLDKALTLLDDAEAKLGASRDKPIPEFVLYRIELLQGSGRNKELRDMREVLAGIDVDAKKGASPEGGK